MVSCLLICLEHGRDVITKGNDCSCHQKASESGKAEEEEEEEEEQVLLFGSQLTQDKGRRGSH